MRIKITIIVIILIAVILNPLTGCTEKVTPETKKPEVTIGVLTVGESRLDKINGLKAGLEKLGFNNNIDFRIFNARDNKEKLTNNAEKLLTEKPDVLVVTGVVEADAAEKAIKKTGVDTIPVVMIGVTSPVDLELQSRYKELGVSFTGVDNGHIELTGKRMELLQLLFPNQRKVIILYDPRLPASMLALQRAEETAKLASYHIETFPFSSDKDLTAFYKRTFFPDEAILTLPSYFIESKYKDIRDISLAKHVPVMGLYEKETEAGYTSSYGISYYDQGLQAARLVIRILNEKGKSIPFEMPDSVQLVINVQAANKIDVKISPIGLSYAKKLYEIKE